MGDIVSKVEAPMWSIQIIDNEPDVWKLKKKNNLPNVRSRTEGPSPLAQSYEPTQYPCEREGTRTQTTGKWTRVTEGFCHSRVAVPCTVLGSDRHAPRRHDSRVHVSACTWLCHMLFISLHYMAWNQRGSQL